MQRTTFITAIILISAVCAHAQDKHWTDGFLLKGFASSSYGFNFNNPEDQQIGYRVFDKQSNTFMFDVFELSLVKDAAEKGAAGMRIDFVAGGAIPKAIHSAGMFADQDVDLKQAYVSYIVPVGNGLRVDFGKFVTHFGYEVIDGNDGYNDNATRSFLFGYAIPFAHTGLRASYRFSDQIAATLMAVNGWDNVVDNNKSKSICAQIAVTPVAPLSMCANMMYGPEATNNNSDNTMLLNFVGAYSITDKAKIGADVVYGSLDNGAVNVETTEPESATWMGIAGYLRYAVADWFALSFRGEQLSDDNGVRTGFGKELKLTSLTLTPEFRASSGFVFRVDLRMDSANEKVFAQEHDAGEEAFTDSQTSLTLNMICLLP